jgi:medium-chain acyl-[acyl-carrier-protein] hydrolase
MYSTKGSVCDNLKKTKLFCFPYAGGSSSIYKSWEKLLSTWIELHPIELAGHGKRMTEPFYHNFEEAIEDIFEYVRPYLDKFPYAFFGHSMGALIAYELTCKILQTNYKAPIHLFLSGRTPPHIKKDKYLSDLPYEQFKNELLKIGGTPEDVFNHPELLELVIPILRADFKLLESYDFQQSDLKINCDITVFSGLNDLEVTSDDILQWNDYTQKKLVIHSFEGDHFFITHKGKEITDIINKEISALERV